uniref:Leukotriene A(4) hydrolase n=1 Tax=Ciona intestinalis TaxID=7719 RepID=F6TTZ5_CIOIN|nr:leukotriene A-4 hydrolase [Ciona intestinalis]|eukprot:XP_002123481.1 leukotriene A-4 hydrolase [Ciona intestinalis]
MGKYDPTSYCDPTAAKIQHINIDWTVDFERTLLSGSVELLFNVLQDDISSITLDSKDLHIKKISNGQVELKYSFGDKHKAFGSALTVTLPAPVNKGAELTLHIEYETSSNASALQWLTKEQTAGKMHPYMFSQCQAIHARSLLPCQDSPSVKATYSSKVTVQDPLVALMSALQCWDKSSKNENGEKVKTYKFTQKVPTPSYLIAIVVGLLESRDIGPRSKVWSEKEFVEKAAHEFAETEKMLAAGEELGGPYVWGQYDLLVLPPSFPYGGMENPCLTFVTPTLLAGDRSLANVIAHEIAHSWTGNLVTNHTWEDFWLNEGHTVFLERKIMSRLNGEKTRHFDAFNGLSSLRYSIETFGETSPYTKLVIKLDDVDPDDSFSSVPYEKGHTLLFYLENLLGGPSVFEPFLLSYINKFKFKSVSTSQWKEHLYEFFNDKRAVLDSVDWDDWFNSPGMPKNIPDYDQTLVKECSALACRWAKASTSDFSSFKSNDLDNFTSRQKMAFLGELVLKDPLTPQHIDAMEKLYHFSSSGNSEIKFRWLRLGIRACAKCVIKPALEMVAAQGRMKFTRPLYRDLGAWDESRDQAIECFKRNKPAMHSTTAGLIEKDLKI